MSFAVAGAAAAGLAGAYISSQAAGSAADKQAAASDRASGLQYAEFEQQRQDQAPWRAAGSQALSQMQDPYFQQNFTTMDMQNDPGYQFRMDQGQKALEASAAARGGLMGGNFGTALSQYGQDYASNEYNNAYNRFTSNQTNRFNRLSSLAGLGQTANAATGAAGQNMANNVGQNMMGAANAQGAAGIASANAYGGALSGIGNNVMQAQMMNRFAPQQPQGAGGGGFSEADMNKDMGDELIYS